MILAKLYLKLLNITVTGNENGVEIDLQQLKKKHPRLAENVKRDLVRKYKREGYKVRVMKHDND